MSDSNSCSREETKRSTRGSCSSTSSSNESDKVQLKRTLNLWNGVSIIIGVIIGSGIFVTPQGVLLESGSVGASLCVWVSCGLLSLLGALCFAELGTSISSSGGEYTYIRLAYGDLVSFLYLWTAVTIISPASNAVIALTFANYVLQPFYSGCSPPQMAIRLLALVLVLSLVYVNCASVATSIKLQNSFTMAKVVALMLIISFGFYYIFSGGNDKNSAASSIMRNQSSTGARIDEQLSSDSYWSGTQTLPHLIQAFYSGFFTYSGWNALNCVTEELKDSVKTMPKAIMLSVSSITLIYILTNIAYFAVLTRAQILSSSAVAVIFGEQVAKTFQTMSNNNELQQPGQVDYFLGLLFGSAKWLMPTTIALSTVGSLNGGLFAQSRVLFAGARNGHLFSALNMLNVNQLTPVPSLIFLAILTSLYLFTTEILTLINYMVFVDAIFAALSVSTVLTLRYKLPDLERPLKILTLVPILYLLFSLLLIILPIYNSPVEASTGIFILLTGLPAYYLTARWKEKPAAYKSALDKLSLLFQALTLSVTPDSEVSPITSSPP